MITLIKEKLWNIEYGWYTTFYSFRIWADIMGSHYDDDFYKTYSQQEKEDDYIFYFWDSLNDGLDGWIYK
jgi:hypothetical protein